MSAKNAEKSAISKCTFYTIGDQQTHFRVHNGEKPFNCKLCDKNLPIGGNLKDHEQTHDEKNIYKCPECKKVF